MWTTKLRAARISAVALALASSGCVTSTFVATDGRAAGRPETQPALYMDRLPPVPFYSVGIIEVRSPSGDTLDKVVAEAVRKGGEVGCDFVVDRAIYRVSLGIPGARAVLAQYGAYPPVIAPAPVAPAPTVVYQPPPSMREFICGVAERPSVANSTPGPLPATAPAAPDKIQHPAHVSASTVARTAPADVAPSLTALAVGQPLVVVGDDRGGWVAVKLPDGRTGYVRSAVVQIDPARP
jgi:hypothetical protein